MDIHIHITLKYPYGTSLLELNQLASIWKFQITKAKTTSKNAEITIENSIFERMFLSKAEVGAMAVPDVLTYFVQTMNVN